MEQCSYIFVPDFCIEYPYNKSRKFTKIISNLKTDIWLELGPLDATTVIEMHHSATVEF